MDPAAALQQNDVHRQTLGTVRQRGTVQMQAVPVIATEMASSAKVLHQPARQQLGLGDRRERQVCGRGARPCYRHVTEHMILSPPVVLSAEPSARLVAASRRGSSDGSSPPSAAELVGRPRKWSSGRGGCAWSSATAAHDDPAPLMTAESRPCGALGPTLRERGCVSRDIAARGLDLFLRISGPIASFSAIGRLENARCAFL